MDVLFSHNEIQILDSELNLIYDFVQIPTVLSADMVRPMFPVLMEISDVLSTLGNLIKGQH